jgi:hypothetical protein
MKNWKKILYINAESKSILLTKIQKILSVLEHNFAKSSEYFNQITLFKLP